MSRYNPAKRYLVMAAFCPKLSASIDNRISHALAQVIINKRHLGEGYDDQTSRGKIGRRKAMDTNTMGKTVVKARITNLNDMLNAKIGLLSPDQVRSIEVEDALVDTGARLMSMPKRLIQQLGLVHLATRP